MNIAKILENKIKMLLLFFHHDDGMQKPFSTTIATVIDFTQVLLLHSHKWFMHICSFLSFFLHNQRINAYPTHLVHMHACCSQKKIIILNTMCSIVQVEIFYKVFAFFLLFAIHHFNWMLFQLAIKDRRITCS